MTDFTVIHENELMGSEVLSRVNKNYFGSCKVEFITAKGDVEHAVFPDFNTASAASCAAINPSIGGYHYVKILETTRPITHQTAEDWLFF